MLARNDARTSRSTMGRSRYNRRVQRCGAQSSLPRAERSSPAPCERKGDSAAAVLLHESRTPIGLLIALVVGDGLIICNDGQRIVRTDRHLGYAGQAAWDRQYRVLRKRGPRTRPRRPARALRVCGAAARAARTTTPRNARRDAARALPRQPGRAPAHATRGISVSGWGSPCSSKRNQPLLLHMRATATAPCWSGRWKYGRPLAFKRDPAADGRQRSSLRSPATKGTVHTLSRPFIPTSARPARPSGVSTDGR